MLFVLQAVRYKEIDDSVDRIVAGMEGKPLVDGKAKSLVAYHEVGHAVCGTLQVRHSLGLYDPGTRSGFQDPGNFVRSWA